MPLCAETACMYAPMCCNRLLLVGLAVPGFYIVLDRDRKSLHHAHRPRNAELEVLGGVANVLFPPDSAFGWCRARSVKAQEERFPPREADGPVWGSGSSHPAAVAEQWLLSAYRRRVLLAAPS
jgi:hypothetical protein